MILRSISYNPIISQVWTIGYYINKDVEGLTGARTTMHMVKDVNAFPSWNFDVSHTCNIGVSMDFWQSLRRSRDGWIDCLTHALKSISVIYRDTGGGQMRSDESTQDTEGRTTVWRWDLRTQTAAIRVCLIFRTNMLCTLPEIPTLVAGLLYVSDHQPIWRRGN
jgi:hypothetical protein